MSEMRPDSNAGTPKVVQRRCPLCNEDNRARRALDFAPAAWPMKACACGMVYLERAPDISELYENLAWEKQFSSENARRHQSLGTHEQSVRRALRRFRPFPRKNAVALTAAYALPGAVIDVGCGSGDHLAALPPQFTPTGIEISAALAQEAESRTASRGGVVVNADALSGLQRLPTSAYSAVIMRSFLEHDINPAPILAEVARVLGPGGVVVIKVPNYASWNRWVRGARWCGFRFPDHVNYFTPATLRRVLEDAGLTIRSFGLLDRPPTSDNMWLVGVRPGAPAGAPTATAT